MADRPNLLLSVTPLLPHLMVILIFSLRVYLADIGSKAVRVAMLMALLQLNEDFPRAMAGLDVCDEV